MHLSFTDYEISLPTEDNPRHIIDRAVVLVETLISVYDRGTWVAEVDILKAFRSLLRRVPCKPSETGCHYSAATAQQPCTNDNLPANSYHDIKRKQSQLAAVSVENWDELIEAPSTGSIAIRAHKNWLARLAATALCTRERFTPIILPENPCWKCCAHMIPKSNNNRHAFIC